MRMFDPMLAYQTFEASSLTDLADKSNGLQNLRQKLLANEHVQKLQEWAIEPHTQQPVSNRQCTVRVCVYICVCMCVCVCV
jgi:hypothetical protein